MENQHDFQKTGQILKKYPRNERYLLAILQDVQKKYNYLPPYSSIIVFTIAGVTFP
jgi:NADH:ubiquinone oxidoreductase subunit E